MPIEITKFCNIYTWLELSGEDDVAWAIRHYCLDNVISTPKKGSGLTFLWPEKGSLLYSKLVELMNSSPDAVAPMFRSLALPLFIDTPSKFKEATKIGIGNKAGFKMEVDKIDGDNVIFKKQNGDKEALVIKKNTSFKPLSSIADRVCVWTIVSGAPPTSGTPYKPPKKIKGGNVNESLQNFIETKCNHPSIRLRGNIRALLAQDIEIKYEESIQSLKKGNASNTRFPFWHEAAVSMLIDKVKSDDKMMKIIAYHSTYCPVSTFYILFEPYKSIGVKLIDDNILSDRYISEMRQIIDQNVIATENLGAAINKMKSYSNKIQQLKDEFYDSEKIKSSIEFRNYAKYILIDNEVGNNSMLMSVIKLYEELQNNGNLSLENVNGVQDVIPEIIKEHYKTPNTDSKMLWQDELKYYISETIKVIQKTPVNKEAQDLFIELCNKLKLLYNGDNYPKSLMIFEKNLLRVDYKDHMKIMIDFIDSSSILSMFNINFSGEKKMGSEIQADNDLSPKEKSDYENKLEIEDLN